MSGTTSDAGRLLVRIEATTAQLRQQLQAAERQVDGAARQIDASLKRANTSFLSLDRASQQATQALAGFAGRAGPVGSALSSIGPKGLAAAAAIGALTAALNATVRAAEQFERLGMRTEAVIRATGGAAGFTSQGIRQMSATIAAETLASAEGVEAAAQKLMTFRSVGRDVFERTLRAAQDLAAVGFGTLESSAVQLGKALEDPTEGISALTRVGVSFSESQKNVIKQLVETGRAAEAQRLILAAVEQQVGGAGAAEAGGLAGAFDTLSQNVQTFLVNIGNSGPIQAATASLTALASVVSNLNNLLFPSLQSQLGEAGQRLQRAQADLAALEASPFASNPLRLRAAREAVAAAQSVVTALNQQAAAQREATEAAAARGQAVQAGIARDRAAAAAAAAAATALERRRPVLEALERELDAAERELVALEAGTEAREELAVQLEVERRLREAGIPAIERQTAAERETAEQIERQVRALHTFRTASREREQAIQDAERRAREAAQASQREIERHLQEVQRTAERIAGDIATTLFQQMTNDGRGQSALDWFKALFRRIAIEAIKANVVLPITTSVVGGMPGLFGVSGPAGSAGGIDLSSVFGLAGLGNALSGGSLMSGIGGALGLTGAGGLLSTPLFMTQAGAMATTALPAGMLGPVLPATALGPMGMGATLGSVLGGAGLGFGAGTLLNSLVGGKSQGGMVGSGTGALAGALIGSIVPGIGTLIGGLIGGAGGGLLGGLIGPGKGSSFFNVGVAANDNGLLDITTASGKKAAEQLDAATRQTAQEIAALNEALRSLKLTVSGFADIGSGVAAKQFGSLAEAGGEFSLRSGDARIQGAIDRAGGTLNGGLQAAQEAAALIQLLDGLAKPTNAFAEQLKAVEAQFGPLIETAKRLGFGEAALNAERQKALATLEQQRAETLADIDTVISARRLRALGRDTEAAAMETTRRNAAEVNNLRTQLEQLGLTAEQVTERVGNLAQVQAAEAVNAARANLVAAYEREASALEQTKQRFAALAGTLRQFRESLGISDPALSPEARLSASRERFTRIAAEARLGNEQALADLPQASREFLDVSREYYASSEAYFRDFDTVRATLEAAEQTATRHSNIADQQLETLREQVGKLVAIQQGVLSVAAAIQALNVANQMASGGGGGGGSSRPPTPTPTPTPTPIAGLSETPFGVFPSAASAISSLYTEGLNRAPDAEGQKYWLDRISQGIGWDNLLREFTSGALINNETVNQKLRDVTGFATGGSFMVGGAAGNDNLWLPNLRLTAGEMVNVTRGDSMASMADASAMLAQEFSAYRRQSAVETMTLRDELQGMRAELADARAALRRAVAA
jgi:hypothetical protein